MLTKIEKNVAIKNVVLCPLLKILNRVNLWAATWYKGPMPHYNVNRSFVNSPLKQEQPYTYLTFVQGSNVTSHFEASRVTCRYYSLAMILTGT